MRQSSRKPPSALAQRGCRQPPNPDGAGGLGGETASLRPGGGRAGLPGERLLSAIFGHEKTERLASALRFARGGSAAGETRPAALRLRHFGLVVLLLFLQSLFIAIDYLPVTLEVLGRDRSCVAGLASPGPSTVPPGR